ncbi:MAG TPA: riboflavin synthase [Syntrophomonadaceae bacterium]|nr:riboflavin synthase [Syntrophomonadaceae bacterium]
MFTGIIEELGTVQRIEKGINSSQLYIQARQVLADTKIGDSIAVNGVCLTVTEYGDDYFVADVMAETLLRTTLKQLSNGTRVNLERALRVGDRMGGHIVQGHVDGVGTIVEQRKEDIATIIYIKADPELLRYIVPKGSIAIDGISLTVVDVQTSRFSVSIIPHTEAVTTLGLKRTGEQVNLETDIIGRYVERLLSQESLQPPSGLSINTLAENGFI